MDRRRLLAVNALKTANIRRHKLEQAIEEFVGLRRLAVVGVSRNDRKFGNTIYKELKAKGYEVFGVNRSVEKIGEEKCYPDLTSLKGMVDGVIACISPDQVEPMVREVSSIGVHYLWLQQGAESKKAVELGEKLGINVVKGKCILMYAGPVNSIHKIHRLFNKVTGRL